MDSSEISSRDREDEHPTETSLAWDFKGIDLSSQDSNNLQFNLESSEENNNSIEQFSYRENHTDYRQVWIPDEEVNDSLILNWTRVRPNSFSAIYPKKLDFEESQRHLIHKDPEKLKVPFGIPNKIPLCPLI